MEITMDDMSSICFLVFEIMILGLVFNIILQDLYFSFHYMFLVFLQRVSIIRKIIVIAALPIIMWKFFFDRNEEKKSPGPVGLVNKKVAARARTASAEALALLNPKKLDDEKLSLEGVKMTIDNLTDSSEIVPLFDEEVSEEEVMEAFGLFDKNKDGFIDAKELRNVLCSLAYTEASEADCKRMISAFDVDGDGRIDFSEFVKLLEYSFS